VSWVPLMTVRRGDEAMAVHKRAGHDDSPITLAASRRFAHQVTCMVFPPSSSMAAVTQSSHRTTRRERISG